MNIKTITKDDIRGFSQHLEHDEKSQATIDKYHRDVMAFWAVVGGEPLTKEIVMAYERFMQLRAVKFIDEIIPYAGKSDLELLTSSLQYQIRFLGEDYLEKDWDGKQIETELEKRPYFLKRRHPMSSTALKDKILEKNRNIDNSQCNP